MTRHYPYLEHHGPIPFAHRGGTSSAPENTLPAFQHAVDLGYRYLETDVQLTADGVLVAFHDDDLQRTTGRVGRINQLSWSEVRSALVGGREPIPLLEDLLGSFPDARINIDCKSDEAVDALVSTLRRTASLDRVCIGSFSTRRLQRLRTLLGDDVCTSLGPFEVVRWLASGLVGARRAMPGLPCAQVPVGMSGIRVVTERSVAAAHAAGMHVHVWTINDEAEMNRLLDLGVDGIMTDDPALLRRVLEERGLWQ
jgi:glycerophosphoryl diester phosphodiesterase